MGIFTPEVMKYTFYQLYQAPCSGKDMVECGNKGLAGYATICGHALESHQVGVSKNWFNTALKWDESAEYFGKKKTFL